MHFYPFHIGDFRSGTINMTRQERWIYRDMMDSYYDDEKPLSDDLDVLCEKLGVRDDIERAIVQRHLRFKFIKADDGYHHEICDRVIAEYHAKSVTAKANGKKSAATRYQNGEYMPNPGVLYAVRVGPSLVKVGVSANIKSRLHQLRNKYGAQAYLAHQVMVSKMGDAEADLLAAYETSRSGEEIPVDAEAEPSLVACMDRIAVAYKVASGRMAVASSSPTNQEPITNNQKDQTHCPPSAAAADERRGTKIEPIAGVLDLELPVERVAKPRGDAGVAVRAVFTYWQGVMGTQAHKLEGKRERAIKGRLKDGYTIEDLCDAVDGCKSSPHHMGQNDRNTVYNDIELICRDGPHVDNFRNRVTKTKPTKDWQ
jgi:uncharacterized protein YdaU (DUF1376 family)